MKIQVIFEQNIDDSVHQTEFSIFEDPSDHLFSKFFQMINQSFFKNYFISILKSWKIISELSHVVRGLESWW